MGPNTYALADWGASQAGGHEARQEGGAADESQRIIGKDMGEQGQWYVAAENDTPRRIAGKLASCRAENSAMPDTLSAEDIVALNRSRYPTLTVSSKLLANTQIFLGSGVHVGERVRDAGAHCLGERRAAESLHADEPSLGKRIRESDLLTTCSVPQSKLSAGTDTAASGQSSAQTAEAALGEVEAERAEQAVSARHASELSPEPEHINMEDFDYDDEDDDRGPDQAKTASQLDHSTYAAPPADQAAELRGSRQKQRPLVRLFGQAEIMAKRERWSDAYFPDLDVDATGHKESAVTMERAVAAPATFDTRRAEGKEGAGPCRVQGSLETSALALPEQGLRTECARAAQERASDEHGPQETRSSRAQHTPCLKKGRSDVGSTDKGLEARDEAEVHLAERRSYLKQGLTKLFKGHGWFEGRVEEYDAERDVYKIVYVDDDDEEMTYEEMKALVLKCKKRERGGTRERVGTEDCSVRHKRANPGHRSRPEQQDTVDDLRKPQRKYANCGPGMVGQRGNAVGGKATQGEDCSGQWGERLNGSDVQLVNMILEATRPR